MPTNLVSLNMSVDDYYKQWENEHKAAFDKVLDENNKWITTYLERTDWTNENQIKNKQNPYYLRLSERKHHRGD